MYPVLVTRKSFAMRKLGKNATKVTKERAGPVIASRRKEIDALDLRFVGEGIGVAQALDELRKALDEISTCLNRREYEKASSRLAYGPVTENFIFLQRALAGLHGACMQKQLIVQEVAAQLRCAYEEALPYVDAVMPTAHPLTEKERQAARKALPEIRARIRAMTEKGKRNG